jgi:hypothetical protein
LAVSFPELPLSELPPLQALATSFPALPLPELLGPQAKIDLVGATMVPFIFPIRMQTAAPAINERSYKRVRAAGTHKEATSYSPPPWRKKF